MRPVVIIPTVPERTHYLDVCLRHIRAANGNRPIVVMVDRWWSAKPEARDEVFSTSAKYAAIPYAVDKSHDYYGNSYNVFSLFQKALEMKQIMPPGQDRGPAFDFFHYCEDDVMVKPDCFDWHERMHDENPDIFAACGWVANPEYPVNMDDYFLPWYYAPNASFTRATLASIAMHGTSRYYEDMRTYVLKTFKNSVLHGAGRIANTKFYEQDAVIQYMVEESKQQVAWRGTALCHHIGAHGYNRKDGPKFEGTLDERITKVEALLADPHWRAALFGKAIVEREIGASLAKREFLHRITLPGGWQSELVSELKRSQLPKRLNSSDCSEATIESTVLE